MRAFLLPSLVLRGSVRQDVLAVGLRLGSSMAKPQASWIRNSRRHPAPGCRLPDGPQDNAKVVDYATQGVMPGAGRSRCQPGSRVLLSRTARTTRLTTTRWWPTFGGTTSTVAAKHPAILAGFVAPVSEVSAPRLAAQRTSEDLPAEAKSASASFAVAVSTRENEGR
jgi:hypothetical protein